MEKEKRRELMEAYKGRHPQMGVVAIRCTATGDAFFAAAKDTKAVINGARFQLELGSYRNRELMRLWKEYGPESFEFSVAKELKYEDPAEDHSGELEELLAECLTEPGAKKL